MCQEEKTEWFLLFNGSDEKDAEYIGRTHRKCVAKEHFRTKSIVKIANGIDYRIAIEDDFE